jgi:ribonuclease HII
MNLKQEKKLKRKGFNLIVGLDEAGRGPLAGPVVAVAVSVDEKVDSKIFKGIKDSKKMSEKKREFFHCLLINSPWIKWGLGRVSQKKIDQINIFQATKLAMRKAVEQLIKKTGETPDLLIIDGNFKIESGIQEKPIIKADEKVFSCMAAGIIAKVNRDQVMKRYSIKYPEYGFNENKGYGTLKHRKAIKKHGQCLIHRRSFKLLSKNS